MIEEPPITIALEMSDEDAGWFLLDLAIRTQAAANGISSPDVLPRAYARDFIAANRTLATDSESDLEENAWLEKAISLACQGKYALAGRLLKARLRGRREYLQLRLDAEDLNVARSKGGKSRGHKDENDRLEEDRALEQAADLIASERSASDVANVLIERAKRAGWPYKAKRDTVRKWITKARRKLALAKQVPAVT
jgi:hypothetical protein